MKFSIAFVAAVAAHTAAGAAINTALSHEEIVDTLLENPHFLPESSKEVRFES
jgi:hypothetical protein